MLQDTVIRPFFQIGRSVTLRLGQQAQRLASDLRGSIGEHWAGLVDSPFREASAGVQRRLPLFFRGLESPGEILFRQFRTVTDVEQVETVLERIPLWFAVLRRWELLPEGPVPERVTLEVLWNTAFARWAVAQKVDVQPLQRKDLRTLQKKLRGEQYEVQSSAFFALAVKQCRLSERESQALQALAEHAQGKLREALAVDATTIELRFIEGLLIQE
jgi:hypothetical protein